MFGGNKKGSSDKAAPNQSIKVKDRATKDIELDNIRATIHYEDGEITKYNIQARSPGSSFWDGCTIEAADLPNLQKIIDELTKESRDEQP